MATKLTYKEQLLHPNWQRKRLEMLEAAGFSCDSCGDAEKTLHVHHRRYIKGRQVWEYENELLQVLCHECHQQEHATRELLDELIAANGSTGLDMAVGILYGYFLASMMDVDDEKAKSIDRKHGLYFEIGLAAALLDNGPSLPWRRFLIDKVKNSKGAKNPVTEFYAEKWGGEADAQSNPS